MQDYFLLVFSLYGILMTTCVLAFSLGRFRPSASAVFLAVVAAFICATSWESMFAVGALFGVGPYSSASYGYTVLIQPLGLFCVRSVLTVALVIPAAWLTLTFFRRNSSLTQTA